MTQMPSRAASAARQTFPGEIGVEEFEEVDGIEAFEGTPAHQPGADPVKPVQQPQGVDGGLDDHAAEHHPHDAEALLQTLDLGQEGARVAGVAGMHRDRSRTTADIAARGEPATLGSKPTGRARRFSMRQRQSSHYQPVRAFPSLRRSSQCDHRAADDAHRHACDGIDQEPGIVATLEHVFGTNAVVGLLVSFIGIVRPTSAADCLDTAVTRQNGRDRPRQISATECFDARRSVATVPRELTAPAHEAPAGWRLRTLLTGTSGVGIPDCVADRANTGIAPSDASDGACFANCRAA